MLLRRRPDWSRRLPEPLTIPEVMDLRTLADIRELIIHLPEQCRDKSTWQHVIACLEEAALDGDTKRSVFQGRASFRMIPPGSHTA